MGVAWENRRNAHGTLPRCRVRQSTDMRCVALLMVYEATQTMQDGFAWLYKSL